MFHHGIRLTLDGEPIEVIAARPGAIDADELQAAREGGLIANRPFAL